jgi:predicted nucleic acid-binding protein
MSRRDVVLDVSVAVQAALEEQHSAYMARIAASDLQLIAPMLFASEACNIVWKRVRRDMLTLPEAKSILTMLCGLVRLSLPGISSWQAGLSLAARTSCSPYDCEYLALAMLHGTPLVTADRALHHKAIQAGLGKHVLWIEDISQLGI